MYKAKVVRNRTLSIFLNVLIIREIFNSDRMSESYHFAPFKRIILHRNTSGSIDNIIILKENFLSPLKALYLIILSENFYYCFNNIDFSDFRANFRSSISARNFKKILIFSLQRSQQIASIWLFKSIDVLFLPSCVLFSGVPVAFFFFGKFFNLLIHQRFFCETYKTLRISFF